MLLLRGGCCCIFERQVFMKRRWFSGKISRCHRDAPGSIPGRRTLLCPARLVGPTRQLALELFCFSITRSTLHLIRRSLPQCVTRLQRIRRCDGDLSCYRPGTAKLPWPTVGQSSTGLFYVHRVELWSTGRKTNILTLHAWHTRSDKWCSTSSIVQSLVRL